MQGMFIWGPAGQEDRETQDAEVEQVRVWGARGTQGNSVSLACRRVRGTEASTHGYKKGKKKWEETFRDGVLGGGLKGGKLIM